MRRKNLEKRVLYEIKLNLLELMNFIKGKMVEN